MPLFRMYVIRMWRNDLTYYCILYLQIQLNTQLNPTSAYCYPSTVKSGNPWLRQIFTRVQEQQRKKHTVRCLSADIFCYPWSSITLRRLIPWTCSKWATTLFIDLRTVVRSCSQKACIVVRFTLQFIKLLCFRRILHMKKEIEEERG